MLHSTIASRNTGERVQSQAYGNICRSRIQKLKKLRLGVFQRRVRHVVNKRDIDPIRTSTAIRNSSSMRALISLGPMGWNSRFIHHYEH
jgi:hypothetical protein